MGNAAKVKGHLLTSEESRWCDKKALSPEEDSGWVSEGPGLASFGHRGTSMHTRHKKLLSSPVISSVDEVE